MRAQCEYRCKHRVGSPVIAPTSKQKPFCHGEKWEWNLNITTGIVIRDCQPERNYHWRHLFSLTTFTLTEWMSKERMPFLKKSEMRGDCDAIPTQRDITSRAFLRNKQDKEERTNTFRNSTQRERVPLWETAFSGVRIVIRGWVIRILTLYLYYDTNSTICQDIS